MYDRNNFDFPPENKALDIAYYISHHAWQEFQISEKMETSFSHYSCHQILSDSLSQCSHLLICTCNRKIQADLVLFLYFCFQYDFNFPSGLVKRMHCSLMECLKNSQPPGLCILSTPLVYCPCIRIKGRDKPPIWNLFFISYFVITSGLRHFLWWGLRKGNSLRLNQC